MSIKKVLEGYQTDFRFKGKRYRQTFLTKKEAADFEQKMKFGGFQENTQEESKPLFEGIKEYSEIEVENKLSKNDEKSFLTEFYNYLVFELNLKYFNQVKLIHLNKYQQFLRQGSLRNSLAEKVEKAKKENAKNKEYLTNQQGSFPKKILVHPPLIVTFQSLVICSHGQDFGNGLKLTQQLN